MGLSPGAGIPSARSTEKARSVLYVVHNRVSLRTLRRVHRLLAGDGRLSFAATLAPDRFGRGCEAEADRWGLPLVPFEAAAAEPWDLALFGNHGGAHLFTRAAARVFVPHGVGAGKLALGQDFTYGPDFVLRSGKPIYTAMFEASEEGRQRAEDITPRLAGRIRVVGDLETDEFLAVLARRATARAVLGVAPEDFLVLLSATWGDAGMLAWHGPALLRSARRLPGDVRVVLKPHPHNWGPRGRPRPPLARALAAAPETVCLVPPWQSWMGAYAAADLAVYDFGSLALRFALRPRPMVAVPAGPGAVTPGSPVDALRAMTPELTEPSLPRALELASAAGVPPDLADLAPRFVSHPGQAAHRTRGALYELLDLAAPGPREGEERETRERALEGSG
ncbi:hypothetical protein [Streptomyces sparsogenes]|uniref:Uncharacterized protein n=1 Tax=Streptomyces sparsogenes DSM 40356 TaxID=1331668 RepID=A0A1R1SDU7_9ACTN|nr:hypothetical protein [Streptomyces sparsogenes]OMI36490.1 hypothetical protein SPAR_25771 [Streptomyces sparsogenes DSM 40356]